MLPSLRKKKDTYKQEPENGDSNPFDSLVGGSLRLFKGHFFTIKKKRSQSQNCQVKGLPTKHLPRKINSKHGGSSSWKTGWNRKYQAQPANPKANQLQMIVSIGWWTKSVYLGHGSFTISIHLKLLVLRFQELIQGCRFGHGSKPNPGNQY